MKRKTTTKMPRGKQSRKMDEPTMRVVPLPVATRQLLALARESHGTNQAAISFAIDKYLPLVLVALEKLGIGKAVTGAKCKKFRLPFADQDLKALRSAASETGLDATFLLKVCLASLD